MHCAHPLYPLRVTPPSLPAQRLPPPCFSDLLFQPVFASLRFFGFLFLPVPLQRLSAVRILFVCITGCWLRARITELGNGSEAALACAVKSFCCEEQIQPARPRHPQEALPRLSLSCLSRLFPCRGT